MFDSELIFVLQLLQLLGRLILLRISLFVLLLAIYDSFDIVGGVADQEELRVLILEMFWRETCPA